MESACGAGAPARERYGRAAVNPSPIISLSLFYQSLQCGNVSLVIPRLVDRCLRNKCRVHQAGIVQQSAKRLQADASLPDALMPIQLRPTRCFGVIAMPYRNIFQTNGCIELSKC